MGRLDGGVFAAFDDDDFRWWIARQADAGDAAGVHRTLGYRDRRGVNAWFKARDERNEIGDYASDLDRAWDLAKAETGSPEAAGLQCRYALLRALLGDLGSRFRPGLAAVLVRHRVWTREQALAWANCSFDQESALDVISDAVDESQGLHRETLMSLATATSTKFRTESGPVRIAEIARTAAPHEQAVLLEGIMADTDKGGKLAGLQAIIPSLPADLLPRALTAARTFEDGERRAKALVAVASVMPPDHQHDIYAEVLATVRDELSRAPDPNRGGTSRVNLLETLAATLPADPLEELIVLVREAELPGYDLEQVIGALLCRQADTDPTVAIRRADKLSTGPREKVLAAAANAHMGAGRITEAIAAAAAITFEFTRASVLMDIAPHVRDIEDPALLEQVRRLSPYHRIRLVRALAAHADRPALALLAAAQAGLEPRDRLRAQAAMTPALTSAEIAATWGSLMSNDGAHNDDALGELAPRLTIAQARTALGTLVASGDRSSRAISALAVRLTELGAPEEALAQVAGVSDRAQLDRPEMLATLAPHLPERLLPAARAAVQPAACAEERVVARTALLAHFPPDRATDVVAEAAALGYPTERVSALASLVAAGHGTAEALLTDALRDTYASRHVAHLSIALKAVQTVTATGAPLSEQFVDAVQELPSPRHRVLALLAIARSGRTAAAQAASRALVDLLHTGGRISEDAPGMIEAIDTTYLSEAILAVRRDEAFAVMVSKLAGLLRACDLSAVLRRALAIDAASPRLLALSSLRTAAPALAPRIAAAEHPRLNEWSADPVLPLGLEVLVAGGIEADQELIERAWAAVLHIEEQAQLLAHVTTLAKMRGSTVPSTLVTDVLDAVLHLDSTWRWRALAALAPRLTSDDLAHVLPLLRHAQSGDEHAELAGACCGVRAAELHDEPLMLALLTAVPDPLDRQAAVMAAADRLPSQVLRTVADHATDNDALAAIAVSAAAHDDHHLVHDILRRITSPRETTLIGIAGSARPLWAESLLPSIRELWEGPRAEALAALVPHVAPERRAMLVEEAVHAAHGYSGASAPARGRILRSLAAEIARLPPVQVARLWDQTMRVTSLRGRDEVLVDLAALAEPLIEVFGPSVALELDDAIQLGATDRWP